MTENAATPAELTAEVENAIARVAVLVAEGNEEGAAELSAEAETMISAIKLANTGQTTAHRKTLRNALAAARKPKVAEVAVPAAAPVAEQSFENLPTEIQKLAQRGAKRVETITQSSIKGGREIAELIFDMRRRLSYEGLPDLNADGWEGRMASRSVFDIFKAKLPEPGVDERADEIRDGVTSMERNVRNFMTDVRVEYFRALDTTTDEAELAPYAELIKAAPEGTPVSHVLANKYLANGVAGLQTRAEAAKAKRELDAAKKAIAAKPDAELTDEERELISADAPKPEDLVDALVKKIDAALKPLDDLDTEALDAKTRRAKADALGTQIAKLQALKAELGI
jgi:hypothetical protein